MLLKNQFEKKSANVQGAPSSGHHGQGGEEQWTCLLDMFEGLPVLMNTFINSNMRKRKGNICLFR